MKWGWNRAWGKEWGDFEENLKFGVMLVMSCNLGVELYEYFDGTICFHPTKLIPLFIHLWTCLVIRIFDLRKVMIFFFFYWLKEKIYIRRKKKRVQKQQLNYHLRDIFKLNYL